MEGSDRTTRQRIAETLRERPATPSALGREFGVAPGTALSHVRHVARSLEGEDEEVLVAPPECEDCGFTGFDDRLNRPSRCPECKSEAVAEPAFRIE